MMDSRQSRSVILETNKSVEQYDQHSFDLDTFSGPWRGRENTGRAREFY